MTALITASATVLPRARRRNALHSTMALHQLALAGGRLATAENLRRTADRLAGDLAAGQPLPAVMGTQITAHALDRWQQRVGASGRAAAGLALTEMLLAGRRQTRPSRRFRTTSCQPGTVFVAWAERPNVLLVVRDRHVLTVLTARSSHSTFVAAG